MKIKKAKCKECGMTLDLVYIFLECLKYKKFKFEDYENYPSKEIKQSRIQDVIEETKQMRKIRDNFKKGAK